MSHKLADIYLEAVMLRQAEVAKDWALMAEYTRAECGMFMSHKVAGPVARAGSPVVNPLRKRKPRKAARVKVTGRRRATRR